MLQKFRSEFWIIAFGVAPGKTRANHATIFAKQWDACIKVDEMVEDSFEFFDVIFGVYDNAYRVTDQRPLRDRAFRRFTAFRTDFVCVSTVHVVVVPNLNINSCNVKVMTKARS